MKIKSSFWLAPIAVALVFTHSYLSLTALCSAALHELGHIFMARICKIELKELRLGIFGASLTPASSLCSYKKEILLCLSGPAVNLLCFALFLPLCNSSELAEFFAVSSLFLGILNLLPIHDLDGGRILKCLLCEKLSYDLADTICRALSFLLVTAMWLTSVYLLLRTSASLSLFVFSTALFCKIFLHRKN